MANILDTELTNLVNNILSNDYPLINNSINYDLFIGLDEKFQKDILFYNLKRLCNSKNYFALMLFSFSIENMNINFVKENKYFFINLIQIAINSRCERANLYLIQEYSNIMTELDEFTFFLNQIYTSKGLYQNKAISILKNIDKNMINMLPKKIQFYSFFTKKNHRDIFNELYQLNLKNKKIYITGLVYNHIDRLYIIKEFISESDYELIDFIYLYLD